jgi:hypothetical protein
VNALAKGVAGLHFAEEREHADVAGAYFGHGTKKQDHQQECGYADANEAEKAAAATTTAINNSAPGWIKDRHRSISRCDFRRGGSSV